MNSTSNALPPLLSAAFQRDDFQAAVIDALDWVPELKHESLVCTHLSSALRKQGNQSSREVTANNGRRYDMEIEGHPLEAKYHLDGDILDVLKTFEPDTKYIYNPKGWNSAPKAIHDELNRLGDSWFLWMICVRDFDSTEDYIYPSQRTKFKKATRTEDFSSTIKAAEGLMSCEVVKGFNAKRSTQVFLLPTIRGSHSALVSRLYHVAATRRLTPRSS